MSINVREHHAADDGDAVAFIYLRADNTAAMLSRSIDPDTDDGTINVVLGHQESHADVPQTTCVLRDEGLAVEFAAPVRGSLHGIDRVEVSLSLDDEQLGSLRAALQAIFHDTSGFDDQTSHPI